MDLGNGPVFCTVSRGHRAAGFATDGTLTPGTPLNPRYVLALVTRVAAKAGIERRITPHTLRHTFATHLLRRTGNLELTRKALRHSRITTTATVYSHLLDRDVEQAVRDLRQEATPADPQVQALAEALAKLTPDQRQALAAALGKGGSGATRPLLAGRT